MSDYAELYKDWMQFYRGFTLICQGVSWRIEDGDRVVGVADSAEAARVFVDASR